MSNNYDNDPADRRNGGHAPFSEEQIVWLEESRRRSVYQAVKHYRNQSILGFTTLLIGLLVTLGIQQHDLAERRQDAVAQRQAIVDSGRAVSTNSCNSRYLDRVSLRSLLQTSLTLTEAQARQGKIPKDRADLARDFYTKQIIRLKLPDCRVDAKLLTSDPNHRVPFVKPYYPGSPEAPKESGG